MYDLLTTAELKVLQSMLYEGAEEAYRLVASSRDFPRQYPEFRATHREIALEFIEAGTELLKRLDQRLEAA